MTTENQTNKSQLEQLKEQADDLGLTYPSKVTIKNLKQMIAQELC